MEIKEGMRAFETGATRNIDTSKLDFEAFYSPEIMEAYGTYMNFNRDLPNGGRRDGDNWQKGIPLDAYMKSGYRHFFEWWKHHRGHETKEGLIWALTGLLFNVQGYLHETIKANPGILQESLAHNTKLRVEALAEKARNTELKAPDSGHPDAAMHFELDNAIKKIYSKQNMVEE